MIEILTNLSANQTFKSQPHSDGADEPYIDPVPASLAEKMYPEEEKILFPGN